jgi:hypothetical protein
LPKSVVTFGRNTHYEELLIGDNAMQTTHSRVMKAHEPCPPADELWRQFAMLGAILDRNDVPALKHALAQMLPGYQPHAEVVDWVHLERHSANAVLLQDVDSDSNAIVGGEVLLDGSPRVVGAALVA